MARKSISEMFGELLRELGVLVIAFAPLELRTAYSDWFILIVGLLGALFWIVGVLIETKRGK